MSDARSVTIRPARPKDAAPLAEFAARIFHETFAADNRPEDMALHLAQSYGVEQQRRELADPEMQTLLADSDDGLAGFAQLRRGPTPPDVHGEAPIELLRFYIAQPWHGRGLAQRLMEQVLGAAARVGARTLWLGVWERNERAKAFYRKCGFVDVGTQIYVVGSDPQRDRLMARPVAVTAAAHGPQATPVSSGLVEAQDPAPRRFLHGTRATFLPGARIAPGHASNFSPRTSRWVYFTETASAAAWGAELAKGDGPGRIYVVEPTGPFVDDPNLTDKKFPGNPTKSYRSRDPLRVVSELLDWPRHTPEEIDAMKAAIAGLEPIDD